MKQMMLENKILNISHISSTYEYIWIQLPSSVNGRDIFICVAYRPPQDTHLILESILDDITANASAEANCLHIVCGDFNVPGINWDNSVFPSNQLGASMENLIHIALLRQCVPSPTRFSPQGGASLLDLILLDESLSSRVHLEAPLGTSDHSLITCSVGICMSEGGSQPRLRKLYHLTDWSTVNEMILQGIHAKSGSAATNDVDILTDCVTHALRCSVIVKPVDPANIGVNKPWFDRECFDAWSCKRDAYAFFCASPNQSNWLSFKTASKKCNNIINRCKADHLHRSRNLFFQLRAKPGAWWHALKFATGKGHRSGTPPLLHNSCILTNAAEKADVLGWTFYSITSDIHAKQTQATVPSIQAYHYISSFDSLPPSLLEVRSRISAVKSSKAAGPDAIGAIPLLKCIDSIAPSLHKVICKIWSGSEFPARWKRAHVVPIPKSSPTSDPSNFRPISLVPLMSKISEECMAERLISFLDDNNIIHESQYGFRKGCSSFAPLLLITQRAANIMDAGNSYCFVTLDFKRAFDSVWHRGLLAKLSAIGLPSSIVSWFSSYLVQRSFQVIIEGASSCHHDMKGGIPQGSVLGPTLFSIYINDLLPLLKCDKFCFADDLSLAAELPSSNFTTIADLIQSDLDAIDSWSAKWLLPLNPSKCSFMIFSANKSTPNLKLNVAGVQLSRTESIMYLGVNLTHSLSWSSHTSMIRSKAKKQLGALIYSRSLLSDEAAFTYYKAYVRSNLEYCSPLWAGAPKCVVQGCDRIQARAIKVLSVYAAPSHTLQPLHVRRLVGGLSYLHGMIHGHGPVSLKGVCPSLVSLRAHTRLASDSMRLTIPHSRTNRHMNSFIPYFSRVWNNLPLDLRILSSQQSFKKGVNMLLCNNPP